MGNAHEGKDQQEQQLSLALDDPREADETYGLELPEDAGLITDADQKPASTFFNRILAALRR